MSDDNVSALVQRPNKPVDIVRDALERMKPQLAMALPRHLTADRLVRVAMTAVQTTPKLLECDRTSFYRAIMVCAQLGLEPDGVLGQAFLVPFGKYVQFIPGYKGLITLARNSGDVATIVAREVCENDVFEYNQAAGDPPHHPFDFRAERGKVIGFYAIAKFKDGSFQCEPMSVAEVETIRDRSQGYRYAMAKAKRENKEPDTPWHNNFVEMAKKTCIRRLAKYLPMSVQKAAALSDSYDTGKHVTLDNHGELVIEAAAETQESGQTIEHRPAALDRFEQQHGAPEPEDEAPPEYELEPREAPVIETGGHERWIDNFNALEPRADLSGAADWRTYAEGAAYLISQASKNDLNSLEISKHPHLKRLREENNDLYRSLTATLASRARELAADASKAA